MMSDIVHTRYGGYGYSAYTPVTCGVLYGSAPLPTTHIDSLTTNYRKINDCPALCVPGSTADRCVAI